MKTTLPDQNQNVWELSAIQLCGWTSLPIIATSVLILEQNTFYGAMLTIIVGNAILWFIRLGIILMSRRNRQSALDVSRSYMGNIGGYFIGVLLLVSTLAWFIAQTSAASGSLSRLIAIEESPDINQFTQMSVLLGVISTFLCMEGIVVLRRLSSFSFPLLIVAFVTALFVVPFEIPERDGVALSLSGLSLVLATNLGITSDLPTFFRHSRSLKTSIVALTVIQVVSICLAICGLFFGSILSDGITVNSGMVLDNVVLRSSLVIFIFISVICANVANVYSASVGWEILAPTALIGRKEYLILGLGLTTIFIMVANLFSVEFLLNIADGSLVNLCLVLILGFIVSRYTKKSPRPFDQYTYFAAWLIATVVNIIQFSELGWTEVSPLLASLGIILLVICSSQVMRKTVLKRSVSSR